MKMFFCNGTGKDKYGNPEKSSYLITFQKIYIEIKFPYDDPEGKISTSAFPRDYVLSDDKLITIEGITEIISKDIPLRIKRSFIKTGLNMRKI